MAREGRVVGLLSRLGGMLVAPRQTLAGVVGGGRGGVGDLIWLLALQVIAVQLPQLVIAVLIMVRQSYSSGMSLLLNTVAASSWMPLAAAILGAVLVGPFTRGHRGRERSLDVTALCAVPAVELQLVASLVTVLLSARPRPWLAVAVLGAGGIWFLLLLLVAGVKVIRATAVEPAS